MKEIKISNLIVTTPLEFGGKVLKSMQDKEFEINLHLEPVQEFHVKHIQTGFNAYTPFTNAVTYQRK